MATTVKTATMEAETTKQLFVKTQLGKHCNGVLPYFFTCPYCSTSFCSECYKVSPDHIGAVICTGCSQVLYFATANKKTHISSTRKVADKSTYFHKYGCAATRKQSGCTIGN